MTQPKSDLAYLRSEKAKAEQRAGMLESFLIAPEELTNDQVMRTHCFSRGLKTIYLHLERSGQEMKSDYSSA